MTTPNRPDVGEALNGRWYFVSRHGIVTLCASEQDARDAAAEADRDWPHHAPHIPTRLSPPAPGGDAVRVLIDAARAAECSCTLRERDSGHRVECWMPDLRDALAAFAAAPAPAVEREALAAAWDEERRYPGLADLLPPAEAREPVGAHAVMLDDLAMIVRKLARELLKAKPDAEFPQKALDYLDRKGLHARILRAAADHSSNHHVHRGPESLPCYCPATMDHSIGDEALASAREPVGAVWLMPVATDAPQNPKLQRYAWGRSNLTDAQMAHAYDCIVSAAQDCGQVIAQPRDTPRDSGDAMVQRLADHLGRRGGPLASYNREAQERIAREYLTAAMQSDTGEPSHG